MLRRLFFGVLCSLLLCFLDPNFAMFLVLAFLCFFDSFSQLLCLHSSLLSPLGRLLGLGLHFLLACLFLFVGQLVLSLLCILELFLVVGLMLCCFRLFFCFCISFVALLCGHLDGFVGLHRGFLHGVHIFPAVVHLRSLLHHHLSRLLGTILSLPPFLLLLLFFLLTDRILSPLRTPM